MYYFDFYTMEEYIELRNKQSLSLTYTAEDFEDTHCHMCHGKSGIYTIAYSDRFGQEYYCKSCIDKFKNIK